MLQIAFLLAGATFVRKAAPFFMVAGLLWGGLGLAIFLDGLQGGLHFPARFWSVSAARQPGVAGARLCGQRHSAGDFLL